MNYLNDKVELFKQFISNEIIKDNKLSSLRKYKEENINKFDSLSIEEKDLINNIIDNPKLTIQNIDIEKYIELIPNDKEILKNIIEKLLNINITDEVINKLIIHISLLKQIKRIM